MVEPVELQVQIAIIHLQLVQQYFPAKNSLYVIFNEPTRAITPGQSAVFYDKDIAVYGGIIGLDKWLIIFKPFKLKVSQFYQIVY